MNRLVSLIGAPTDIGASVRGASMGPEALRVADIGPVLVGHGLDVVDRGNLGGPANPWQPPHEGYRHLDAVAAWNRTVHDAVYRELARRVCRSCSAAITAWASGRSVRWRDTAVKAARNLRVLWLDAHADFNTDELHRRRYSRHAGRVPVRVRAEAIDRDRLARCRPISASGLCQIGIRSVDPGEKRLVH